MIEIRDVVGKIPQPAPWSKVQPASERSRMSQSFRLVCLKLCEMLTKVGSRRNTTVSRQDVAVAIEDDRRREDVGTVARIQDSVDGRAN